QQAARSQQPGTNGAAADATSLTDNAATQVGRPAALGTTVATPPKLNRFHGSVQTDPLRLGRDAARIAEEVVQHLSGIVAANVEITLEIHADLPDGASDKLV